MIPVEVTLAGWGLAVALALATYVLPIRCTHELKRGCHECREEKFQREKVAKLETAWFHYERGLPCRECQRRHRPDEPHKED